MGERKFPIPEVMDLHYVPKLDVWRLVNRDVWGRVQDMSECANSALMADLVQERLASNPHLTDRRDECKLMTMPEHVCVRVWMSV